MVSTPNLEAWHFMGVSDGQNVMDLQPRAIFDSMSRSASFSDPTSHLHGGCGHACTDASRIHETDRGPPLFFVESIEKRFQLYWPSSWACSQGIRQGQPPSLARVVESSPVGFVLPEPRVQCWQNIGNAVGTDEPGQPPSRFIM